MRSRDRSGRCDRLWWFGKAFVRLCDSNHQMSASGPANRERPPARSANAKRNGGGFLTASRGRPLASVCGYSTTFLVHPLYK
ncbi:hypothetical protein M8818_002997 [Zalaria obscura]|uniref:Uncharacterized protein n=1 Tax=Zalaria obscura TaxID=2024903 RepID=A0ACC3SGN3_9PEZI